MCFWGWRSALSCPFGFLIQFITGGFFRRGVTRCRSAGLLGHFSVFRARWSFGPAGCAECFSRFRGHRFTGYCLWCQREGCRFISWDRRYFAVLIRVFSWNRRRIWPINIGKHLPFTRRAVCTYDRDFYIAPGEHKTVASFFKEGKSILSDGWLSLISGQPKPLKGNKSMEIWILSCSYWFNNKQNKLIYFFSLFFIYIDYT